MKIDKKKLKHKRLTLKLQQRFGNEKHNVFTKEVHKIALIANDDKGVQSIYSIETYVYGKNEEIV